MARFVRAATRDDVARIAAIYNQGIEDRSATFEIGLRDARQVRTWLDCRWRVIIIVELFLATD